jgi:oxalate decarboxylase/phosphoglucose isomerase-like protein (cupin superfamily)
MQYDFNDRFDGSADYFKRDERIRQRWEQANMVKNIRTTEVVDWADRGEGNASMYWDMAGNTILEPHVSEFEVGHYKLGHRHPYEAIILTLNGKGFSLAGKGSLRGNEVVKMDWKAGSVVSPPFFWYHQHFNTGPTPARYLAFKHEVALIRNAQGVPTAWISTRIGGDQLDYADEKPEIRRTFAQELAKHGMTPRMDEAYAAELPDLPPKSAQSVAAE